MKQDLSPHHNGGNTIQKFTQEQQNSVWCEGLVESFSGIRGVYGSGITPELAKRYVFCFCQLFQGKLKTVVVGGDTRPSTVILKKAAIKAFNDCGIKQIIDVGVLPVQVCEYSILKFKADGGIYITASHNEPNYNGWKILKKDGALLYAEQSEKLIKNVHGLPDNFNLPVSKKASHICKKQTEAINAYIDYVFKKLGAKTLQTIEKCNLKIILDPNGGSSIAVWQKILSQLKIKAKVVNSRLGEFNRLVEPNVESLAYLNKEMAQSGFAFAAGFDSDADRVEFVINPESAFAKEMGPVVNGNYVLALACEAALEGTKNQIVVTNDVTAYLVRDVIKKYKAKMKEVEVGEMVVVEEMEKQKSIIGGEGSNGGVIIPPIKCRDGILTTLLFLKLLSLRRKNLADILQECPKYYSDRTALKCSPQSAIAIRKKIEDYFKQKGWQVKKTGDKTGGLKALLDKNSYVWFRQSKTEPGSFRIIADADNKEKVKNLLDKGVKAFKMSI